MSVFPREVVSSRLGLESQLVTPLSSYSPSQEFWKLWGLSPDTFPSPHYDQDFLLKTIFL